MSKYFETKKEFDQWITNFRKAHMEKQGGNIFSQIMAPELTNDDYIRGLIADGYTDLDNLIADGHAYEIGGHRNDGWYYRDEIYKYFADVPKERIRDRK